MEIKVITTAEKMEQTMHDVVIAVYDGVDNGIGHLGVKTIEHYKKTINEGLKKYGRGHTSRKESISSRAISLRAVERIRGRSYVDVVQISRAGVMMEVDKKRPGPFYAGAFRVPTTTSWARRWLREKGYYKKGKPGIKLTKNAKYGKSVSGLRPFKPLTTTFNEFTASIEGINIIGDKIIKEIKHVIRK